MPTYVSNAAEWSDVASVAIAGADTKTSDEITLGDIVDGLQVQTRFDVTTNTSGTFAAYVQTSLDEGATWLDIGRIIHTGATGSDEYKSMAFHVTTPGAKAHDNTDAALGSDRVDGILGDRVRIKTVSTGTYVATFYAWVRSQA